MPRVINRLSAVRVTAIRGKGYYPDGAGLYLKVTASGSRSWIMRYTRSGTTRDMGLGAPPTISLAKARELATQARQRLAEGFDPLDLRRQQRSANTAVSRKTTFEACAEALIESQEAAWRNVKHRQQWRNTLRTYAYPILGSMNVAQIDTPAIVKVLQPMWLSTPETASRLRGRIEAVLSWASAHGLRHGPNPAGWRGHLDKILPARNKVRAVRHHPAIPYLELPTFMQELRQQKGIAVAALEFVILTATRTSEAIGAEWSEVDVGARVWTVPASRMKAGKVHRVPLSDRAFELLGSMRRLREGDVIFPGGKQGRPLSNMAMSMLLRDLRPGVTVHGFRSTFRDWVAEVTDFPREVAEASLAHVVADKVEAAYRRGDLFEKRRQLMDAWATYCSSGKN